MDINQAIKIIDLEIDSLDGRLYGHQSVVDAWALVKSKAVALEKIKESLTQRIEEGK
jgi:hypothetical protein